MNLEEFYKNFIMNDEELNIIEENIFKPSNQELVYDPATIYQAYQTGIKIYEIFSKKKDKNEELINYLKHEFNLIKQLLNDVLLKLEELKVLIKEESRINALNNLESIIRIFNESYSTWLKYPNREDVKKEVSEVNIRLKEYNRIAQNHGYAHFHTIWCGIVIELLLLHYLRRPKEEIKTILSNHAGYFKSCLNPLLNNSIKNSYIKLAEKIENENKKYPSKQFENKFSERRKSCDIDYHQVLNVTGSLFEGYDFAESGPNITSKICEGGQGPRGGHGIVTSFNFNNQNFNEIRNKYINARINYLNNLLPNFKDLSIALDTCNYFHNILINEVKNYS